MTRRAAYILAGLTLAIGLVLAGGGMWMASHKPMPATSLVGGPFTLTDQDGRTVTADAFKGRPFLVFFGYTHCPDVCPTTLADMSQVLEDLGKDAKVRAAFVTVDSERDTPAVLKDYLSNFDPRITGLTGSPEAVAGAEKAYRVYARKVPAKDGGYTMDHTAIVYLMSADGQFLQALNLDQPPEKVAAEIRAVM